MFTIKHCHDFKEDLYHSVDSVTGDLNHMSPMYGVKFYTATGGSELHHMLGQDVRDEGLDIPPQEPKGQRGTVFVMNEHGKTVATYHL